MITPSFWFASFYSYLVFVSIFKIWVNIQLLSFRQKLKEEIARDRAEMKAKNKVRCLSRVRGVRLVCNSFVVPLYGEVSRNCHVQLRIGLRDVLMGCQQDEPR